MFLCFSSSSTFIFLVSLERCVILIIFLIFNLSKDKDKLSSTFFIFFINIVGSIPFIFFCSVLEGSFGGKEISLGGLERVAVYGSMLFILLSKVPIFLLHFWLTKAHVRASGTGSIVLARLMLKIGTVGLYKFCQIFLFFSKGIFFSFICCFSVARCLFIGMAMYRFFDLKYIVACSSIVHMALIIPGCLFPQSLGVVGSILIMVGHGLISCFIFYTVRLVYERRMNRSSDEGKRMERASSLFGLILFFSFLINLGFPPFVRFLREFFFVTFFLRLRFRIIPVLLCSFIIVGLVFILVSLLFLFGKKFKKRSGPFDPLVSRISLLFFVRILFVPLVLG